MKPRKRNGYAGKQRRIEGANARHKNVEEQFGYRNQALDRLGLASKKRTVTVGRRRKTAKVAAE